MGLRHTRMRETVARFGARNSLVGIVTDPQEGNSRHSGQGVILLNAGIVHRVGPGRIYVKIARALSAIGLLTLRFDFSGVGDSMVRHDHLCFDQSAISEVRDAMEFLTATRGIKQFILLGGCSGAQISMETACCDSRVTGAVLINFPVLEDEDGEESPSSDLITRRRAHYYWHFALLDRKSWRKLITGKANYRNIFRVLGNQVRLSARGMMTKTSHTTGQFGRKVRELAARHVNLVFLCAQGDPVLKNLREMGGSDLKQSCAMGAAFLDIIPRSDHTFSSLDDQEKLLNVIVRRVDAMIPIESPCGRESRKEAVPHLCAEAGSLSHGLEA